MPSKNVFSMPSVYMLRSTLWIGSVGSVHRVRVDVVVIVVLEEHAIQWPRTFALGDFEVGEQVGDRADEVAEHERRERLRFGGSTIAARARRTDRGSSNFERRPQRIGWRGPELPEAYRGWTGWWSGPSGGPLVEPRKRHGKQGVSAKRHGSTPATSAGIWTTLVAQIARLNAALPDSNG